MPVIAENGNPRVSEDGLLGGALRLRQPMAGDRAAIDPVFLAASVPAKAGERALDVGAGSGAAALCLARRVPGIHVDALEIQPGLARLAGENARLNGLAEFVTAHEGDIAKPPPAIRAALYDHVLTNPPFHEAGRVSLSPDSARRTAHVEGALGLDEWIVACLKRLKVGGRLTLIHRADRIDAIVAALNGRTGQVTLLPLWPAEGKAAARVIAQARKGGRGPARLLPGLTLHEPDGRYTEAAERILRQGEGVTPCSD